MKKHFLYVSTAALLAMGFASCVDNDEPRGLRELRYARANEWNANAEWKRATTYGDSLKYLWLGKKEEYLAKAEELKNLKTEAENKIAIEAAQCSLAVEKAKYDVSLATQKYELAKLDITNEKDIAVAKAELAAKQKALAEAQWALNSYNAQAALRQKQLEKEIADAETTVKEQLLAIQKRIDQYQLDEEKRIADLAKNTFVQSLNIIEEMADAQRDWESDKVIAAYTSLKTKEQAMITAQNALAKANQTFLVAVNDCEKDSLTILNTLTDALATAQNALDKEEKAVELAEKTLTDFKAIDKADVEAWSKLYNDLESEITALDKQDAQYTIEIAEADTKIAAANFEYEKQKESIDKPLNDYNEKGEYHSYKLDAAIADVLEGNKYGANDANGDFQGFEVKQGVIANPNALANEDLNDIIDLILDGDAMLGITGIGDGKTAGKYNLTEDEIKDFKTSTSASNSIKILESNIVAEQSLIAQKEASIEKTRQDSTEVANQKEIETLYNSQKASFTSAVSTYQAKALAYRWSDERNLSTLYIEVAEAIYDYQQLYTRAANDNVDLLYSTTDTKYKVPAARTNLGKKIKDYWAKRTEFDGSKPSTGIQEDVIDNAVTSGSTTAAQADMEKFDLQVASATISSEGTDNVSCATVLAANNRAINYNDDGSRFGAWSIFDEIAVNFIGTNSQYREYNVAEMLEKKENASYPYQTNLAAAGTQGKYFGWKYDREKLGQDIADLEEEIAESNEKIADYKDNKDIDDLYTSSIDDWGIKQFEDRIAVNAKWQALYDQLKAVKDANTAKINELTLAKQEAYKTTLQAYEDKVVAAKDAKQAIADQQALLLKEKGYKESVQTVAKGYAKKTQAGLTITDADVKAMEIAMKYFIIDLEYAIETAKQGVEDKEIELQNAQKDLADFKAGEYNLHDKYFGLNGVLDADKAVKAAQADYDKAVKDYEIALTYYNEVLAAVTDDEVAE